ncbi:hypothetical protein ACYJ5X_27615, partial [Klebsiella pneumoniae]
SGGVVAQSEPLSWATGGKYNVPGLGAGVVAVFLVQATAPPSSNRSQYAFFMAEFVQESRGWIRLIDKRLTKAIHT